MLWSGWGDPAQAVTLSASTLELLRAGLGVKHPIPVPASFDDVELPATRLADQDRARLAEIVGERFVSTEAEQRIRHTRGKSTADLIKLRTGDGGDAPDAVIAPASHDQVVRVLELCSLAGIAVVPFGGGTSVVGGLAPGRAGFTAALALDLGRMTRMIALDEESRTATLEPGLRGPEAEALLAERGYTIGHHPQSFMFASIGGFAAARSSGHASAGYGRFDENVVGLTVATPRGTVELGRAPKSAAGPDLRQLFLGSEGALGVITSVTVQVRRVPELRIYEGWWFEGFEQGASALRRLIQDGPVPTVMRLSDEAETALNLARPTELSAEDGGADQTSDSTRTGGCLAIIGYEGTQPDVEARRRGASAVLGQHSGVIQPAAGEAWAGGRYQGPYLRDALLTEGALVETLETTTFWSNIRALYGAVGDALRQALSAQGTPPLVLCHISHAYPSGASLYFTVACAATEDPVQQWRAAKAKASDAIVATGGSITHHHGIGTDHLPWYEAEIGPLATEALRAVKTVLDPSGILNPGILVRR
ncbi:MAG: FAD-binding oxidoreductase [Solirubrobacteraceae bacterium]